MLSYEVLYLTGPLADQKTIWKSVYYYRDGVIRWNKMGKFRILRGIYGR